MNESRFYSNPYNDISLHEVNIPELNLNLRHFVSQAAPYLEQALDSSHDDMNLYTGKVGIAMSLWRIRRLFSTNNNCVLPQLTLKHQLPPGGKDYECHTHHNNLPCKGIGFSSDAISFHLYYCLSHHMEFDLGNEYYRDYAGQSGGHSRHIEDELLNGRAGLALMLDFFVKKGMRISGYHNTNPNMVQRVLREINIDRFPWSWHDKVYFGAAHGTAGILHTMTTLCPTEQDLNNPSISSSLMTFNRAMLLPLARRLVSDSVLHSGNFRSSFGSDRDRLVQWCHGAPGFIALLLDFYDEEYQFQALVPRVSDLVWERGLLTKGCGICHGIAGNAYTFLAIYQKTLHPESLHRAVCFALVILRFGPSRCCIDADTPYSLFEGLAGTVQFVMDLIEILALRTPEEIQRFELFDGLKIF